jgi:5'-nucleotidase (lipoprotein e(P4) family)
MGRVMKRVVPVWALVLAACGGAGHVDVPAPSAGVREVPLSIRWVRRSAEHRAAFLQAYRLAGERVRAAAASRGSTPWGVILDADETILDNSDYQLSRAELGLGYTQESWTAWVRRQAADTLPGAAGFIRAVHELGGRVVVVTNRWDYECGDTRANLDSLGVAVDLVLCRPSSAASDKNPRFRSVQDGTAAASLPALDVVLWVGDNIQDFPGLSQDSGSGAGTALADFGTRFIVLPDPMYGSWERNPPR